LNHLILLGGVVVSQHAFGEIANKTPMPWPAINPWKNS